MNVTLTSINFYREGQTRQAPEKNIKCLYIPTSVYLSHEIVFYYVGGTGVQFPRCYRNRPKGTRVLHDVEENAHKKPMKRNSTVYFEKGLLSCLMIAVLKHFFKSQERPLSLWLPSQELLARHYVKCNI